MKRILALFFLFTTVSQAMDTTSQPMTLLSFRTTFFEIKKNFEKIKDACKNLTDQSPITISTAIAAIQTNPHKELVQILRNRYFFLIGKQCKDNDEAIARDLALVSNERLKHLLKNDHACLTRAQTNITKTQKLSADVWRQVLHIECSNPLEPTIITTEFLALQEKIQSLSTKVLEDSPQVVTIIESIEQELHTPFAIFLPLLFEPQIVESAEKSLADCPSHLPKYGIVKLLKYKLDELHEKIKQIKDQP